MGSDKERSSGRILVAVSLVPRFNFLLVFKGRILQPLIIIMRIFGGFFFKDLLIVRRFVWQNCSIISANLHKTHTVCIKLSLLLRNKYGANIYLLKNCRQEGTQAQFSYLKVNADNSNFSAFCWHIYCRQRKIHRHRSLKKNLLLNLLSMFVAVWPHKQINVANI